MVKQITQHVVSYSAGYEWINDKQCLNSVLKQLRFGADMSVFSPDICDVVQRNTATFIENISLLFSFHKTHWLLAFSRPPLQNFYKRVLKLCYHRLNSVRVSQK